MSAFRIITEEVHKFNKDNLYVLAFRDGINYGIDVNNSTSNFGRVVLSRKEDAQYLFNIVNEFIDVHGDYLKACEYVSYVLSFNSFDEMILATHTYRRNVEKLEAYALIKMLGFDFEEVVFDSGNCILKLKSKSSNEDYFGEFTKISGTNKFLFHIF